MRKLVLKKSSVVVLLCVLWMMMLLLQLQLCSSITACIQKEREALLQFKNSFYYDHFHRLASWNGTDCCNWNGVGCNQTTGHVIMIDLRWVDFHLPALYSNSVDSSLLELKYLNYLDLSGNYFNYIQIPSFLGSMVELIYLNLSGAYFSGKFLPPLGNFTKLDTLDLQLYDQFDDSSWVQLNDDIGWMSHLSCLQTLYLTGMDFSKTSNLMQVLSSLPLLSSLRLSSCNLQNIHFSLSFSNYTSFLSRVQLLDLSDNQLHNSIPKAFQNMTSLKYINLSRNKFSAIFEGGLSSFIGNNCGLKVFDLSFNYDLGGDVFGSSYENESMGCNNNGYDLQVLNLGGTSLTTKVPDWLAKFQNLKSLDLGNSKIYGPIPASLGNLSSLEYLDVSNNALTGAIPNSFGRLLNLRKLYLQENRLVEVGSECFIQHEKLEELDISTNSLKGILTELHFVNLSQLHTLSIGYNELLSLDMKFNWNPPFQLEYFDATSCIGCFGSEFPQWLQTQKTLFSLVLSNTSLSSSCLPTLFTPHNLIELDLSHNQMVGSLLTQIGDQIFNLRRLFLHDNLINDSLPPSICKLKDLTILDLSNNRLFGMVPGYLLTPSLILLDLSFNNFFGTFPYSHGNLSNIEELLLSNNHFEGSMPIVLENSKNLKILDMEGNKFSGEIPKWIGNNLESLIFLGLRSNLLSGTIPSSLCKLTELQTLDLAHNQLEGSIPPNISNFYKMKVNAELESSRACWHSRCSSTEKHVLQTIKSTDYNYSRAQLNSMVSINLSNNSLMGFIPSEITLLTGLIGLNLSHNNLNGTIPTEMGQIKSLQSLDLSFNQLSGPVPQSLSKLNSLGMLKLSHNNLSGNIPQEGHLSTFNEASSFDGNPYLCGDPLPMKCAIKNPSDQPSLENIGNLNEEDQDKWEKWLLYIMIILGFIVGFWGVVGSLILKKSWRYAYFKFVDEAYYNVHATIWRIIELLKGICNIRK